MVASVELDADVAADVELAAEVAPESVALFGAWRVRTVRSIRYAAPSAHRSFPLTDVAAWVTPPMTTTVLPPESVVVVASVAVELAPEVAAVEAAEEVVLPAAEEDA